MNLYVIESDTTTAWSMAETGQHVYLSTETPASYLNIAGRHVEHRDVLGTVEVDGFEEGPGGQIVTAWGSEWLVRGRQAGALRLLKIDLAATDTWRSLPIRPLEVASGE